MSSSTQTREVIDLTFHSRSSDPDHDSDPDSDLEILPAPTYPIHTMPFRESPVKKRRKTHHSVDEEDEDPEELLRRFQRPARTSVSESKKAKPAPPSRDNTVQPDGNNGEATETGPGPATSEDSAAAAPPRTLSNQRRERDWLAVRSNWGEEPYQRYADCSEGSMELLAYLSKRFPEKTARYYILNETLLRMNKGEASKHGRTNTRGPEEITCGDLREAKKKIMSSSHILKEFEDLQPPPLREDLLKRFNLWVGASGLLEPTPASAQVTPSQSSDPPKKAKESKEVKESPSSSTPSATLKDPAKASRKKTDWKAKNVVDLTTEVPAQAPVKNTRKVKGSAMSDPIAIEDSTSTGRSTPIASTKKSSNPQKTSASAPQPATIKAVNISDSAHSTMRLPVSKLKPNKKRMSSAVDTTSGVKPAAANVQPSNMQRPVGDQQTPTAKQSSNVHSPSSAKPVPSPSNSAGSQTPRSTSDNRAIWSHEDDSLMVYLKTVFGWGPTRLADALGRTSGACSTRYSTKLRNGQISLQEAIDCLSNSSQFSHHLDPAAHDQLLAGAPTPAAGPRQQPAAAEMPHSSMPKRQSPSHIKSKPHNLLQKARPTTEDESSDQSLSTAPGRAKRTRPKVDYDVKKYFSSQMDIDVSTTSPAEPMLQQAQRQGGPHETTNIQPKKTKPEVRKTYRNKKPYLTSFERQSLHSVLNEGTWDEEGLKDWHGVSVHIGLNPQELLKLEEVIVDVLRESEADLAQLQARGRIEALMKDTEEADVFEIAAIASQRKAFQDRTKESIEAALRDAQDGCLLNTKTTLSESRPTAPSITSIVRQRELRRNLNVPTTTMTTMILDTIGPSMSFTGTSNDVNTVAWAPDGVHFAAGSACHVDSDSMQYNRPNNLLFGSIHERTLLELPEHHTLRERPASGPNSSNTMHVTQDRRLFQTVAALCFSPNGKSMYSAGYDGMLRMWDIKESGARQRLKMFRNAKIDLLTMSKNGLLATGAQRTTTNAITIFDPNQSGDLERWSISGFNSRRAAQRPENMIYPSTIRFDPHAGKYLLAGFASTSREELTCGESCLWDLQSGTQLHLFPETRNVFDVAWNPSRSSQLDFAVGCVAGSNVNRGVRSVVKMYDIRSREKCGMSIELDCPALDMNDVMWCPHDENLIVAGCTNGKTYVWDVRRAHPEIPLYSLEHDQPLMELADPESRERLDTGIRFCSWGHSKNRFYTGSSDGVVKSWDLYRAREDALVRNVVQLNSGVMCGSFSPDFTSLLLGEVNGTINVLEVGKEDRSIRDMDSFNLKPASSPPKPPGDDNSTADDDSGVEASKTLMRTGQIFLAPMGGFPVRQALQGPAYAGPFDSAMDAEDLRDKAAMFQENLASANDNGEQCDVEECGDVQKLTEEECGDSGRWKDRIPAALTLRPEPTDVNAEDVPKQRSLLGVTPSLKCSVEGCDRPVRLRPDNDAEGSKQDLHCERHDFGALRPGHNTTVVLPQQTVDNRSEAVTILSDDKVIYRADVLGYKRLQSWREQSVAGYEEPVSRTWKRRIYGDSVPQDDSDQCGMDEWHASLWGLKEAPDAPPFLLASPPASRSVSRAARRDSPKYLGEHRAAPPSPGLPDNGAQQGGAGADAQSATPLDSLDRQDGHDDDGDGGVQHMDWESTPQGQGQMQQQMQPDTLDHAHDHEENQGNDAMDLDLDSDPRQQSTNNAIPIESGSAGIRNNAGGLVFDQEGNSAAAATAAVESVEPQDEAIGTRRPSSIASSSSSQHSAASNNSGDSNRSRTPCVPM
ncbi:uncharacterized protein J3D65DRAFT_620077 [Phyllosticta citribraziliensis]|uniref:Uncharacterized protein n=1 Tax=Phyllosticta citribraziliensis TaxID=989973 RepID=A0ABR1LXI3_9PEZI